MSKHPIRIVLILFLIFPFSLLARQVNNTDTGFVRQVVNKLAKQPVSEKVYLHLDKPYYIAGDDIWFKAHVTSGVMHKPSNLRTVLIVQLISYIDQRVKDEVQLPVKSGLSIGDFHLPFDIPPGKYYVKAYTNYILESGGGYFTQPVTISNTSAVTGVPSKSAKIKLVKGESIPATESASDEKVDVQFLPESGNLVNGINSVIAFKAINKAGESVNVAGVIKDNQGNIATQFTSTHLGMGSFNLYPLTGMNYRAELTFADGSHQIMNLPAAADAGCVLSIYNKAENPNIAFRVSVKNIDIADSSLMLIARSGEYVCYATKVKLKGSIISGTVPKSRFPTGIAQFTLFGSNGEPLAERIVFINNHDQLNIALNDSNSVNLTNQQTTFKVQIKGFKGISQQANFSVAVVDDSIASSKVAEDKANIVSYLLLTSDLKGEVEKPGYYFKNENDSTANALDLLMLTQGYRGFKWEQILKQPTSQTKPLSESGLSVSGKVVSNRQKPVAGSHVTLFNKANSFVMDTVTDKEGRFEFSNLFFTDSLKFLVSAKAPDGGDNVKVVLDTTRQQFMPVIENNFQKTFTVNNIVNHDTGSIPELYKKQMRQKNAIEAKNSILLKEVNVKAHRDFTHGVSSYSANLNGPGNADEILTSKDLEYQGGDLPTILSGKLAGVRVVNGYLISARALRPYKKRIEENHMQLIYNGVYWEADLKSINPLDIESIEVLKSAGFTGIYGSRALDGVVIITSKHGSLTSTEPPPNAAYITLKGFNKARLFYSPKYNNAEHKQQEDVYQSTVYWNPNLTTDNEGKAVFNYHNSNTKGTYRVIIEGFDSEGRLGYRVFKYHVE